MTCLALTMEHWNLLEKKKNSFIITYKNWLHNMCFVFLPWRSTREILLPCNLSKLESIIGVCNYYYLWCLKGSAYCNSVHLCWTDPLHMTPHTRRGVEAGSQDMKCTGPLRGRSRMYTSCDTLSDMTKHKSGQKGHAMIKCAKKTHILNVVYLGIGRVCLWNADPDSQMYISHYAVHSHWGS